MDKHPNPVVEIIFGLVKHPFSNLPQFGASQMTNQHYSRHLVIIVYNYPFDTLFSVNFFKDHIRL